MGLFKKRIVKEIQSGAMRPFFKKEIAEKKGAVYEKENGCRTADSLTISFLFELFKRGFTR